MSMITNPAAIRIADYADEAAAGRAFPQVDRLVQYNHALAHDLLTARRSFWLDAAAGYLAIAEDGFADALQDARDAFTQAELYMPACCREVA